MIRELTGVYMDATKPAPTITQLQAHQQEIRLPRGEHLTVTLFCFKQNRTVKDLTGITLRMTLRLYARDTDDIWTKVASPSGADATAGKAVFTVPLADTENLSDNGRYVYDVHLIEGGQRWQVVPPSQFLVLPIVNRSAEV